MSFKCNKSKDSETHAGRSGEPVGQFANNQVCHWHKKWCQSSKRCRPSFRHKQNQYKTHQWSILNFLLLMSYFHLYIRIAYNWTEIQINIQHLVAFQHKLVTWQTVCHVKESYSQYHHHSWLNWPITFKGPDLKRHRLTNTVNMTLKMTSV